MSDCEHQWLEGHLRGDLSKVVRHCVCCGEHVGGSDGDVMVVGERTYVRLGKTTGNGKPMRAKRRWSWDRERRAPRWHADHGG